MFALFFSMGEDLMGSLALAVVGMTVVFSGLLLINWFIALLGKLMNAKAAPEEVVLAAAPAQATPTPAESDAKTVAVITAAAFAAVGRPVRVQRITFINHNTISAWAERGRVSIHGSHNIRRPL